MTSRQPWNFLQIIILKFTLNLNVSKKKFSAKMILCKMKKCGCQNWNYHLVCKFKRNPRFYKEFCLKSFYKLKYLRRFSPRSNEYWPPSFSSFMALYRSSAQLLKKVSKPVRTLKIHSDKNPHYAVHTYRNWPSLRF